MIGAWILALTALAAAPQDAASAQEARPEEVDLLRLVTPEEAKAMRAARKWTWWRLSIGADGTWHSFKKAEPPGVP